MNGSVATIARVTDHRNLTGQIEALRIRVQREKPGSTMHSILVGHLHTAMMRALQAGVPAEDVADHSGKSTAYVEELASNPPAEGEAVAE